MDNSGTIIHMSTVEHNPNIQENRITSIKNGITNQNFIEEEDDDKNANVLYEAQGKNQFVEKFTWFPREFIFNGILNVTWNSDRNKYVSHPWKFMFAYTMWFLVPLIGLNLAPFVFQDLNIEDSLLNPVVSMLGIVVPALQAYTLHIINLHAKNILKYIDKLPVPKRFEGSKLGKSLRRLFVGTKKIKSFVAIVPRIILVLALLWWSATIIYYFIENQVIDLWEITQREWWYLIITGMYAALPMFSLRFIWCVTLWLAELYKDMQEDYSTRLTKKLAKTLAQKYSAIDLQSLFNEIRGITRFGLSINLTMIFFCALYSTIKLFGGANGSILYIIPFTFTLVPLSLFCRTAGRLLDAYEKLLYEMKKKSLEERELSPILLDTIAYLELAEPRLFVFGGYYVGFSLTFTVIGFIFTYSSLVQGQ